MGFNTVSLSPEATYELGRSLAHRVQRGEIILLYGGLGAGKTLLTKGLMAGLGYDVDEVTSPSFTLVNLYRTERSNVYHIDLWRLEAGSDVVTAVGLEEILEDETAIAIIEWADRLGDTALPARTWRVQITGDGDDPRDITVDSPAAAETAKI
jgi:tRNA threonylcarbamoyladenosine biosynthesis protein TsaE